MSVPLSWGTTARSSAAAMRADICRCSPAPLTRSVFAPGFASTSIDRSARIANGPTRSSRTVVYLRIGSTSCTSRTTLSHEATRRKSRSAAHAWSGDAATRTVRATSWNTGAQVSHRIEMRYKVLTMSDTNAASATEQKRPSFWGRGAYELFIESEGIPIHAGADVPDLRSAQLGKWAPRREGRLSPADGRRGHRQRLPHRARRRQVERTRE